MKALIDADSLLYLSLPKKNNPEQTYEQCIEEIDNRINDIINATKSDEYVLFLTEGKCFRYKNYKSSKNYKFSRKGNKMPPIFYAMKEYMKQKYNAYINKDLEADDLVSYFHNTIKEPTIICSPDKDVLKQSEGVHYNYGKRKRVVTSKEEALKFLFIQLGMGDSTDGIAGIEGVGEKTVLKWFNELEDENYAPILIEKYIDKYKIHDGINRFYETFTMVYILKNDDDMLREIGKIPDYPTFNKVKIDNFEKAEKPNNLI